MPAFPAFCGPSYVSTSPHADGELTMNWYLEPMEVEGKTTKAMYPTPGCRTFATSNSTGGRASFAVDGRAFCVIGTRYYDINSDGTMTLRGTVAVDQYPATISYNGAGGGQNFITSGNNGYIHDLDTNVFSQVRTGATRMGAHLDGYFLALDAETGTLFLSDLLDGTTWDPTQFAQRSIRPDPWIAMKVLDRYIWLFGSETSEVWYDAGTFPFPFAPHPSGLVPYGIGSAFSAAVVAGSLMWHGASKDGRGLVLRSAGFRPDVVSSFPLEKTLSALEQVDDAVGDTYEMDGHAFYILTFPRSSKTVAFDATANLNLSNAMRWADRGTWMPEQNQYDAWRPLHHCFAFGKHLMLDRSGPDVLEVSHAFGLDVESRKIRRVRRGPAIQDADRRRLFVARFGVHVETGFGL
jgi:hypothetical protein